MKIININYSLKYIFLHYFVRQMYYLTSESFFIKRKSSYLQNERFTIRNIEFIYSKQLIFTLKNVIKNKI